MLPPTTLNVPPLFLGLDPGKKGAIALLSEKNVVFLENLPIDLQSNRIDTLKLVKLLEPYRNKEIIAYIEEPACYNLTSWAALSLGTTYGICLASLLINSNIQVNAVKARTWKKLLGLTSSKLGSKEMAQTLIKGLPTRLRHDKAEAGLLAIYGELIHSNRADPTKPGQPIAVAINRKTAKSATKPRLNTTAIPSIRTNVPQV